MTAAEVVSPIGDTAVLYRLAIHESGHALAAVVLGLELHPTQAVVLRDHIGFTLTRKLGDSADERFAEAIVSAAGWATNPWFNCHPHDRRQVRELLRDPDRERAAYTAAKELVRGRREQVRRLADALVDARMLTAEQVLALVG